MILPTKRFQSWDLILFRHQSCRCRRFVWVWDLWYLQWNYGCLVILFHEYCWFHCHSHKSSNHTMFSFHLFTRFKNDLDSAHNSNSGSSYPMAKCWGLASSWELISSGSPDLSRSDGLRGSVEKYFFVTRSNFSCHYPRSFIRSARSVVRRSFSFPLLTRPSTVVIQLTLSLPGCPCRSSATTDFQGSCFLNISSPLLRAHWSWRRHERWRPPKKIHHRFLLLLWPVLLLNLVEVCSLLHQSKL